MMKSPSYAHRLKMPHWVLLGGGIKIHVVTPRRVVAVAAAKRGPKGKTYRNVCTISILLSEIVGLSEHEYDSYTDVCVLGHGGHEVRCSFESQRASLKFIKDLIIAVESLKVICPKPG